MPWGPRPTMPTLKNQHHQQHQELRPGGERHQTNNLVLVLLVLVLVLLLLVLLLQMDSIQLANRRVLQHPPGAARPATVQPAQPTRLARLARGTRRARNPARRLGTGPALACQTLHLRGLPTDRYFNGYRLMVGIFRWSFRNRSSCRDVVLKAHRPSHVTWVATVLKAHRPSHAIWVATIPWGGEVCRRIHIDVGGWKCVHTVRVSIACLVADHIGRPQSLACVPSKPELTQNFLTHHAPRMHHFACQGGGYRRAENLAGRAGACEGPVGEARRSSGVHGGAHRSHGVFGEDLCKMLSCSHITCPHTCLF
jgi:hypothetical protein